MKKIALLILLCFYYSSYAQIRFEKGYFYDNENTKVNCLIKNVDWLNNPTDIKYKMSENGEINSAKIEEVKEFHVSGITFKRFTVHIDRSGTILPHLSNDRQPMYNEEIVFLKELVKGETSLYSFLDGNLGLFFYETNGQGIIPLVYKRYYKSSLVVGENNQFKQQLINQLSCNDLLSSKVSKINYNKKGLTDFFQRYNSCKNGDSYKTETLKNGFFNFLIRPGVTSSTFKIPTRGITNPFPYEYDFGSILGYQIGVELEYVLPFNKNKWSFFIEPSYNTFESESTSFSYNPVDVDLTYKTFEIPIGLRHYFFLSQKTKIFVNASYVLIFDMNSEFNPERSGFVFSKGTNTTIGVGFDFNNKFKIEGRYDTDRGNLFPFSNNFVTDFTSYSVVLGYNFL